MNLTQRIDAVRRELRERKLDALIAIHDGAHYSGANDALFILTGFRTLGPCAFWLDAQGEDWMLVTPGWDADRAAERVPGVRVFGAKGLLPGLADRLPTPRARVAVAGRSCLNEQAARQLGSLLGEGLVDGDALLLDRARAKTDAEIENGRIATQIAERGYERMLELTRPGVKEDELAVELRWFMKSLGAEDNFFMLNAGPHNRAVQPCSSRRLEPGDFVLTELSPLYRGQMTQICRTIHLGSATREHQDAYALLKAGFEAGLEAAKPGRPMSDVCDAVDAVLEAAGYAEYSRPPWLRLRRRGHGLGLGTTLPGDVAPDNDMILEPGMMFVLHPNQYLPQTGYMMCGEPVLITEQGARALSSERGVLDEVN